MPLPLTTGVLRTKIEDMEIGDYINFTYDGNSDQISALGTSTVNEMPLTGLSTNTLGGAYFVKVDKGLLVSDRICRNTRTWDILNSSKNIQGKPTTLGSISGIIRSITGGVAYADANGNMSLTDKGFGAFPTNNEWDRYIVKFPTNKIQSGKTLDDVFHWRSVCTWCQDTPSISLNTSAFRVRRGFSYAHSLFVSASSGALGDTGFRPVFEYQES